MKKRSFATLIPLCLLAAGLPLTACGPATTTSVSSTAPTSSAEPVTPGETSISLTGDDRGVAVGETMALHCSVFGPNAKVHYVSTDPTIATVDGNGVVTGVKPGFVSIHAVSAESEAIYGSYTLFVEPSYINAMVKGFRGNDYANGLSFGGRIAFTPSPASKSSTEEKSSLLAPFTCAVQTTSHPFKSGSGTYSLPSFDFRLMPDKSISSIVSMVLGKGSYSAKDFSIASLEMASPVFYSEENTDAALFGLYQPFSLLEKIAGIVPDVSTIADSLPSAMGAAVNFSAFLEKQAASLNEMISFGTDETEGIALKDSVIEKINTAWPSVLSSIKNSTTLPSALKLLLPSMLPESFKDVRFNVSTDKNAFAGLSLKVTGVKKAGSDQVDTEYHPLTITLQAPSALESTYFSTLKSRFEVATNDEAILTKVQTAESGLYSILSAYNRDLYDTVHRSGSFVSSLKKYNSDTYPLLADVVNTPLIPVTHSSDRSTLDFHYGPYESFDVTKQGDAEKNVLWDRYAPSAGDVFLLSDPVPCGNGETAFAKVPSYAFEITGNETVTASDYATLEGNVLTIKKLPSDLKLTLKITPETVEGYVPLTYSMVLNTVQA